MRRKKRSALYIKLLCLLVLSLIMIGAGVFFAVKEVRYLQQQEQQQEDTVKLTACEMSKVRHISFPQLAVTETEGHLSVSEFKTILQTLYANNYVLIDVYSLAETGEDGSLKLPESILLPEGKKPLVISQRDVSYPVNASYTMGSRLVTDSSGKVKCEYVTGTGMTDIGDHDLVPVLETFLEEHPDFSYNGARGILGLTGYNGILGYRTSAYLGSEAGNPYGVFDTASETAAAAPVVEALKASGWRFACNSFYYNSYGSEISIVTQDAAAWMEQVSPLIGGTDILLLPLQTDIGSWAPYSSANEKYNLLSGYGFRYYFVHDADTPGFLQVETAYVREAVTEINTLEEFNSLALS